MTEVQFYCAFFKRKCSTPSLKGKTTSTDGTSQTEDNGCLEELKAAQKKL